METRKFNFDKPFVGFDNRPLMENGEPVVISDRLGFIMFNVSTMGNQQIEASKKYLIYKLMRKLQKGGDLELTEEEKTIIRDVSADAFSAGAYGQIMEILGE